MSTLSVFLVLVSLLINGTVVECCWFYKTNLVPIQHKIATYRDCTQEQCAEDYACNYFHVKESKCYYGLPCEFSECEEEGCGLLKVREGQCQQDFNANDEAVFKQQFVDAFKSCLYVAKNVISPNEMVALKYSLINGYDCQSCGEHIVLEIFHYEDSPYSPANFTQSALLKIRSYGDCSYKWEDETDPIKENGHDSWTCQVSVYCENGRFFKEEGGKKKYLQSYSTAGSSNILVPSSDKDHFCEGDIPPVSV